MSVRYRATRGTRRIAFGMSASAGHPEATVTMAAVARELGAVALVNLPQMTVSQMTIGNTTPSRQQRQTAAPKSWLSRADGQRASVTTVEGFRDQVPSCDRSQQVAFRSLA